MNDERAQRFISTPGGLELVSGSGRRAPLVSEPPDIEKIAGKK